MDGFFPTAETVLKEMVPEFVSRYDNDDGFYMVLGDFAFFVIENSGNHELMQRCFGFINLALEKGGEYTEEAIVVQLFELFYEDQAIVELTRQSLNAHALKIYDDFSDAYTQTNLKALAEKAGKQQ
ncbi:MAG: hypothetical protein V4543_14400 [Bacteroidota bacterium]